MTEDGQLENKPALFGGDRAVKSQQDDMFKWPIITERHEEAVLKVLRAGQMSGFDITKEFERKYAQLIGRKYGLAYHNGTAAILGALYGLGVGVGDEVIVPSLTYWASATPVYNLGATVVFSDVNPETICIDPKDIERRITPRTKAVIVVHYAGMPADMDAIIEISARHNLKIIEDCSHAHGALYKGKEVGTFGEASAFSLMTGKSLAIGEGGILFTDEREVYERAILFGHYIRHKEITLEELKPFTGLPSGGYKHRIHQLSSAFGLVQLELYPEQMAEIDKAMNYFCDLLEGSSGVRPMRPAKDSKTTKGGWYYPHFKYVAEELEGLSLSRFSEAVRAEGSVCNPGCNKPLHLHPLFTKMDVYGHGRPTRIANMGEDIKIERYVEKLPVAESINRYVFEVPWFKRYLPEIIEEHANAYKKVIRNYKTLLADDTCKDEDAGGYSSFFSSKKNTQ
ncbi:MAG: DegT/DnrJ/EryC1/StrS family aminotransferase [Sedimentisphaerales bacterium]|nr:DegT/DnrJ/EryC1/StrS family aminotransferase [Sedimentisphaerales bacterium]